MIPQNPTWSNLSDEKPYPSYGVLPNTPPGISVYSVSPGPAVLGNSEGKLNAKYWICYQLNGYLVLRSEEAGVWSAPANIVEVAAPIESIGLTFDQLGRLVIIYKLESSSMLKLYWYDSLLASITTSDIVSGSSPFACSDYLSDTSNPDFDAMIFYVNDANSIKYRIQRDRYTIEYSTGITHPGLKIESVGIRVDNRLQILYKYTV